MYLCCILQIKFLISFNGSKHASLIAYCSDVWNYPIVYLTEIIKDFILLCITTLSSLLRTLFSRIQKDGLYLLIQFANAQCGMGKMESTPFTLQEILDSLAKKLRLKLRFNTIFL